VKNTHVKLKVIPLGRTTRGVVFMKPEGTLNLVFDLIDDSPDPEYPDDFLYSDWGDPTRRSLSTFHLIPPAGAGLYRSPGGGVRHQWIVVPVDQEKPAPATLKKE